jgi:hypothetical protein
MLAIRRHWEFLGAVIITWLGPDAFAAAAQAAYVGWRTLGRYDHGSTTPRKFYWRYKAGSQRAVRDGDWKYLRIAGNEFLFDVVKDPRERGNLKDRHKDVYDRLKADWEAWNDTMLPERSRPASFGNPGVHLPDHYGVVNPAPPQTPAPAAQR